MEKVKLAVVGLGRMGCFRLNVISHIEDIELSGIYDTNENVLSELSTTHNINKFSSLDEAIDKSDAIIIATPTINHFEITKMAIEKSKHILVEKPMTETHEQAEEIAALVKKYNIIFQVGHVERFNGAVQNLKTIVKNPILIEARRLSPFSPRIADVGVVFDIMIHDLDIVMSFVGKPLINFEAHGKRIRTAHEDVASALLEFEGNTIATISSSRITEEKIRTLAISSPEAYFTLDYATQDITIHRQATSTSNIKGLEGINYKQESTIERVFIHRDNPLKLEVQHFIKCILKKESPIVSIESDVKTLYVAENICKQIKASW